MDHMRTMVRTGCYFNALHAPFQLLDYHNSTNHFWACQAIEISGFEEERWIQNECGQCILVWELPIFLQSTLRSIEKATSIRSRAAPLLNQLKSLPTIWPQSTEYQTVQEEGSLLLVLERLKRFDQEWERSQLPSLRPFNREWWRREAPFSLCWMWWSERFTDTSSTIDSSTCDLSTN